MPAKKTRKPSKPAQSATPTPTPEDVSAEEKALLELLAGNAGGVRPEVLAKLTA